MHKIKAGAWVTNISIMLCPLKCHLYFGIFYNSRTEEYRNGPSLSVHLSVCLSIYLSILAHFFMMIGWIFFIIWNHDQVPWAADACNMPLCQILVIMVPVSLNGEPILLCSAHTRDTQHCKNTVMRWYYLIPSICLLMRWTAKTAQHAGV